MLSLELDDTALEELPWAKPMRKGKMSAWQKIDCKQVYADQINQLIEGLHSVTDTLERWEQLNALIQESRDCSTVKHIGDLADILSHICSFQFCLMYCLT